jgi:hypothetical protein
VVATLVASKRRPKASLATATWTSAWVSTPTVTRVGTGCVIVVMAASLVAQGMDGTHRPGGLPDGMSSVG